MGVTEVAEFHHVVDANALIAVIIVVALPESAEGIDRDHPVVAEIPAQCFKLGAIHVAAENHALTVGFPVCFYFESGLVHDQLAVLVLNLAAGIAKVEIQLAVRPHHDLVNAVIVLGAGDAAEEHGLFIGLIVAVLIGEDDDLVADADNDAGVLAIGLGEDGDAVRRKKILVLVKCFGVVGFAVAVLVFDDDNAITLGAGALRPR